MRKILSFAVVTMLLPTVIYATSVSSNLSEKEKKVEKKGEVKKQNSELYVEYKTVSGKCYHRECTISKGMDDEGNVYTERTCSDWVEVDCGNQGGNDGSMRMF